MSDAALAMLACPHNPGEPNPAFEWFPQQTFDARRFLAVTVKTRAPNGIHVINLTANYPAELARIESLAAMTRASDRAVAQPWDSLSLFSLRRLLDTNPEISRVALLRGAMSADPECLPQAFAEQEKPFTQLAQDPAVILYNRDKDRGELALGLALDVVFSGAIYSLDGYALETLLDEVQQVASAPAMDGLPVAMRMPGPGNQAADHSPEEV